MVEEMALRDKTCCFTGHRDIPAAELPELRHKLEVTVAELIQSGIRFFGSGGARGFDLEATKIVLEFRNRCPQVRLILVLPCRDQAERWNREDRAEYERLKALADKVVYTAERYTPGCMRRRNRHLVDGSSVCVAYCTRSTGGTAYTMDYARRQGLRVILL